MDDKAICIQVPRESRFVNIGVDSSGELEYIRIAFVDVMGIIGMIVIDPDGNMATGTILEDAEVVSVRFTYFDVLYNCSLISTELAYELTISQYVMEGK